MPAGVPSEAGKYRHQANKDDQQDCDDRGLPIRRARECVRVRMRGRVRVRVRVCLRRSVGVGVQK